MKFGLHNLKIMVIYKMLISYMNIYMYRRRNNLSDLQTKLGSGMNKLQEGIEQGKMKLQVAQEIAQLKKGMQVQMQKKAEVLLEVGQQVYVQLRGSGVNEASLKEMIAPVQEFDVAIYQARKRIVELQNNKVKKLHVNVVDLYQ